MSHQNFEIKSRCADLGSLRAKLAELGAVSGGTDEQKDTYFHVPSGRLKLRQGNIENSLIQYERPDEADARSSAVTLAVLPPQSAAQVREVLLAALNLDVVVSKTREILWHDNVKFHLDEVDSLGMFCEIEAIDYDGSRGAAVIEQQCREFIARLELRSQDTEPHSYSDLLRKLAT